MDQRVSFGELAALQDTPVSSLYWWPEDTALRAKEWLHPLSLTLLDSLAKLEEEEDISLPKNVQVALWQGHQCHRNQW